MTTLFSLNDSVKPISNTGVSNFISLTFNPEGINGVMLYDRWMEKTYIDKWTFSSKFVITLITLLWNV